jgi:hypothetical protein
MPFARVHFRNIVTLTGDEADRPDALSQELFASQRLGQSLQQVGTVGARSNFLSWHPQMS